MNDSSPPQIAASQRWDVIDVARGLAICAMVVYHFSWDLSYLKLISTNVVEDPGWRWFARAIAGSFLVLVGVSLALAHARGFRRRAFLRRLSRIAGSAALVTLVTYFAFPESYIFFGILHCIAVSSLFALPFLRLPTWLTLIVAIGVFATPFVLTSPAFDAPWLDWLGLGLFAPATNDYEPIFPWFAMVLLGLVLGRGLLSSETGQFLAGWSARDAVSRGLIWAGRKSLPIYLLHQPILMALLFGILQMTGPNPVAEARPFMAECQASCTAGNSDAASCRALCSCVVTDLRKSDLWSRVLADTVASDDQRRISQSVQQCLRSAVPQ